MGVGGSRCWWALMRNSLRILKRRLWQEAHSHNHHTSELLLWGVASSVLHVHMLSLQGTQNTPVCLSTCMHTHMHTLGSFRRCLLYLRLSNQECFHLLINSCAISPQQGYRNLNQLTWHLVIMDCIIYDVWYQDTQASHMIKWVALWFDISLKHKTIWAVHLPCWGVCVACVCKRRSGLSRLYWNWCGLTKGWS